MVASKSCRLIMLFLFAAPLFRVVYGPNPIFFEAWSMFGDKNRPSICVLDLRQKLADGREVVLDGRAIGGLLSKTEFESSLFNDGYRQIIRSTAQAIDLSRIMCTQLGQNSVVALEVKCGVLEEWTERFISENICKPDRDKGLDKDKNSGFRIGAKNI